MSKNVPNPQVTNEVNKFIKNKLNKPQKNQNSNAKGEFKILNKVSGNQDQVQVGKNEPNSSSHIPENGKNAEQTVQSGKNEESIFSTPNSSSHIPENGKNAEQSVQRQNSNPPEGEKSIRRSARLAKKSILNTPQRGGVKKK